MKLKKLPVGIQNFGKIVEQNYLYIDKTKYIYNLITNNKYIFFSRPRRFGKSLLLDTISEIFKGNKHLFKGLWLYNSDYTWDKHPVIKLDLSSFGFRDISQLEDKLLLTIKKVLRDYKDINIDSKYYDNAFDELIFKLHEKYNKRVVILIDEYDAPIINTLEDTEKAIQVRNILRNFYKIIKANDAYIRFTMLTGVSRFSKAGVFSALNNLNDITVDTQYSTMLGITQKELISYFDAHIKDMAHKEQINYEKLLTKIKFWYNGFCFNTQNPSEKYKIYNPFSILLLFHKKEFRNYWFDSGTPKFLIDLIIRNQYNISNLEFLKSSLDLFDSYEPDTLKLIPLLFQTGYITLIKKLQENLFLL